MVAVSRDQGQIHCDVLSAMFVYKVPLCGTAALTDFIVSPRTELLDMTMFVLKTLTIQNFTTHLLVRRIDVFGDGVGRI